MGYVMNETKAGRELDRAIAEKVMGRKVTWDAPDVLLPGPPDNDAPNYSTSIDAAWEVVEKLRPEFDVVLECVTSEFNCHINKPGRVGTPDHNHVRADTAPMAICLAALKAVGE